MGAMKALTLSDASVMLLALQDEIRRSQDARYDHRLHAVLLVAQGQSCREVARLLGDAPRSVENWVHRFEARGFAGLLEGQRAGRPSRARGPCSAVRGPACGTRSRSASACPRTTQP